VCFGGKIFEKKILVNFSTFEIKKKPLTPIEVRTSPEISKPVHQILAHLALF
jgi:hypothetical protein